MTRLTLLLAQLATAGLARAEIVPSTTNPKDVSGVSLGVTVSLTAPATTDDPPLSRQWQHNGTNLSVPDSVWLRLTNVTELDAGEYRAIFSDAAGNTATSRVATLTVDASFIQASKERLGDDGFLKTGPDYPAPSWLDYDGDGWLDVLFARGWMGDSRENELYRNNRDGTFSRITNALTQVAGKWQSGAAPTAADFDNDGDLDFVMVQWPPLKPILFVSQFSQGVSDFTPVPLTAGLGFAASFADLENDGWADLAVTAHAGFQSAPSALLHNAGGHFQVITNTPFALSNEYLIWHNWVDYDEDGDIDCGGGTM
ncbi:MAG: FG-GAP-like repeat-containing protein, partial [Limisphaerales bacterium]